MIENSKGKTVNPAVVEHMAMENERLRGLLRLATDRWESWASEIIHTTPEYESELSEISRVRAALSQKVEPAPAQDEQKPALPVDSEAWLQEWARGKFTYTGAYKPRVLGQLYGNTDWALARSLHSAIVSQLHAPIAQTAPPQEQSGLREALEGMLEYFPEGASDGECFAVDAARAALSAQGDSK